MLSFTAHCLMVLIADMKKRLSSLYIPEWQYCIHLNNFSNLFCENVKLDFCFFSSFLNFTFHLNCSHLILNNHTAASVFFSQKWWCNLLSGLIRLLPDVLGLSDLYVNYCCAATNFEETLLLPVCSGHDATSLWINPSSQRPQTLSAGIQSCNDYHQRAAVVVAVLLHHCLWCVFVPLEFVRAFVSMSRHMFCIVEFIR